MGRGSNQRIRNKFPLETFDCKLKVTFECAVLSDYNLSQAPCLRSCPICEVNAAGWFYTLQGCDSCERHRQGLRPGQNIQKTQSGVRERVASGPCSGLHPSLTAVQKLIASVQQPRQAAKQLIALL